VELGLFLGFLGGRKHKTGVDGKVGDNSLLLLFLLKQDQVVTIFVL